VGIRDSGLGIGHWAFEWVNARARVATEPELDCPGDLTPTTSIRGNKVLGISPSVWPLASHVSRLTAMDTERNFWGN